MEQGGRTAVLAGAREAHGIITALMARGRDVIASLPEPERVFGPLPVSTRVGAFASLEDIIAWFDAENVATVIDASHVFDSHVSSLAYRAAQMRAIRYLRVARSPWRSTNQDLWMPFATVREAVNAVGPGLSVFSNTGWASLPSYAGFRGSRVFFRQTHPVTQRAPYRFIEFIEGTPPFSKAHEEKLFRSLGVSRLICRNVGGAASMSKLLAARTLGIPVLMVERPPVPAGALVADSVAEALAWEADG